MRTIEITATVMEDGTITLQLPPGIPPGEHRIVVVIDETLASPAVPSFEDFPVHSVGSWPEGLTFRREDLYGDWGR